MTQITQEEISRTAQIFSHLKWDKEWNISSQERAYERAKGSLLPNLIIGAALGAVGGGYAVTLATAGALVTGLVAVGVFVGPILLGVGVAAAISCPGIFKYKKELKAAQADLEAFEINPAPFIGGKLEEDRVRVALGFACQQHRVAEAARALENAKESLDREKGFLTNLQERFAPVATKPATTQTAKAPANDAAQKPAPKKTASAGKPAVKGK